MFACFFAFIEIISCAVDAPQPTAQVETVKAVSPADASVQLVVDHGLLKSRFSGTAIAPNLVVTCWHGFRDKGTVTVNGKPAKLLRKDEISDVALVEIEPELAKKEPLNFLPIAKEPAKKGEPATAYGYEYNRSGLWKFPTRITAVNRYTGFDNVSIAGRPNQGRSGGGLFNEAGELIGVCSASDGNEGLYCGLEAVQKIVNPATSKQVLQVPTVKALTPGVSPTGNAGLGQDCPDGRCPLLPKQGNRSQVPSKGNTPTLAPPEPRAIVQAKPLRSVMVQPVRRARVFSGRIIQRIFGRR